MVCKKERIEKLRMKQYEKDEIEYNAIVISEINSILIIFLTGLIGIKRRK